jgi:hypothetical protein
MAISATALSGHTADVRAYVLADDLSDLRAQFKQGSSNPLSNVLSDEVYSLLRQNDLLNEKSLRDYIIRQMFTKLKAAGKIKTAQAIEAVREMYPYLQYDTIRKIVYGVYPGRKSMM